MVILILVRALLSRLAGIWRKRQSNHVSLEGFMAAVDAAQVTRQYCSLLARPDVNEDDVAICLEYAKGMADLGRRFLEGTGKLQNRKDIEVGLTNAITCLLASATVARNLEANRKRPRLVRTPAVAS